MNKRNVILKYDNDFGKRELVEAEIGGKEYNLRYKQSLNFIPERDRKRLIQELEML